MNDNTGICPFCLDDLTNNTFIRHALVGVEVCESCYNLYKENNKVLEELKSLTTQEKTEHSNGLKGEGIDRKKVMEVLIYELGDTISDRLLQTVADHICLVHQSSPAEVKGFNPTQPYAEFTGELIGTIGVDPETKDLKITPLGAEEEDPEKSILILLEEMPFRELQYGGEWKENMYETGKIRKKISDGIRELYRKIDNLDARNERNVESFKRQLNEAWHQSIDPLPEKKPEGMEVYEIEDVFMKFNNIDREKGEMGLQFLGWIREQGYKLIKTSPAEVKEGIGYEAGKVYHGTSKTDSGVDLIAAERIRQIEKEGWSAEHDQNHDDEELVRAAICYAIIEHKRKYKPNFEREKTLVGWPWHMEYWKPTPFDRVRELVKAGALIAAQIDLLKRNESNQSSTEQGEEE